MCYVQYNKVQKKGEKWKEEGRKFSLSTKSNNSCFSKASVWRHGFQANTNVKWRKFGRGVSGRVLDCWKGHTRRGSTHDLFPPLCFQPGANTVYSSPRQQQQPVVPQKLWGSTGILHGLNLHRACVYHRLSKCTSRIILEDASRGSGLFGVFHTL